MGANLPAAPSTLDRRPPQPDASVPFFDIEYAMRDPMIEVQIASQITPQGVEGIRWVLVDPTDSCSATAPTPADRLSAAVAPVEPSTEGKLLSVGVLKLALTGLGLGLALWTAQAWLGAPTAPGLAPTADPRAAERAAVVPPIGVAPTPMPTPTPPAATQPAATPTPDWAAPAASAASAPAATPLITAALR